MNTSRHLLFFSILLLTYLCVIKIIVYHDRVYLNDIKTLQYFRFDRDLDYKKNKDLSKIFEEAFSSLDINIKKSNKYLNSDILFFESYDLIDLYFKKLHYPHDCKYIYGVNNTDSFVNKAELYKNYEKIYNKEIIKYFLPETYYDLKMKTLMELPYNNQTVYIAKKNIQQQKGLILFKSYDEIKDKYDKLISVVQKVLQDPFLVNGRKINIRIYLLVKIIHDKIYFYIYNNGFMYYTPEMFKKYSTNPDEVITTGYIDRSVYVENPLTLQDFYNYLGKNNSQKLKSNIYNLFRSFKEVFSRQLLFHNRNIPGTKFSVFGCDVAPDTFLNCKLIEINKGPDLSYKDNRDKHVKLNMVRDMFKLVGLEKYGNTSHSNNNNNNNNIQKSIVDTGFIQVI